MRRTDGPHRQLRVNCLYITWALQNAINAQRWTLHLVMWTDTMMAHSGEKPSFSFSRHAHTPQSLMCMRQTSSPIKHSFYLNLMQNKWSVQIIPNSVRQQHDASKQHLVSITASWGPFNVSWPWPCCHGSILNRKASRASPPSQWPEVVLHPSHLTTRLTMTRTNTARVRLHNTCVSK